MSALRDGLLYAWSKNQDYGARLVDDLTDEQMVWQPAPPDRPPANHPAWILSHLNVYLPVIAGLIEGSQFDDPKNHRFGMLSKPEPDRSLYPSKDGLINDFVSGHERVSQSLSKVDDSLFATAVSLDRWKEIMPTLAIALPFVMLNHENMHLGQLSTWRRVQGMPSV